MKVTKNVCKRLLPILLAITMVFSMMPATVFGAEGGTGTSSASQFSDMPENWSTKALQSAVANGLLSGADGKIMPDQNLTRAQMATVITRAFGATVKGDLGGFADVKSTDWFSDGMAKAYQMGVIQGSGSFMNPNSAITRQEVFVILARAFKLQPAETINKTFVDANQIADWAKGEVFAFVNAGYIQGANGKLNPKNLISRAEFAQIFDNILKQYIDTAGEVTQVATGNIMINAPGVTLKNLKVNGDLIIGDGVGNGEATLDSVTVTGRLVIRGGGENSIIIKGTSSVSNVIVARVDGVVSVKVQGDADVEVIYIDDGSDDVNVEGIFGNIEIAAPEIVVNAIGATITTLNIAGEGAKLVVDSTSKVSSVTIQAPNTQISGSGTVTKVEAQAGATGSKIETPNTQISVGAGVSGVTGGGNTQIQPGSTVNNNPTGSGTTPATAPPPTGNPGNDPGPSPLPTIAVNNVTVNSATSVTFSSIAAPSGVTWNGTAVPAGSITYNANIVTIAVPKITSITNTLVVSAAGYTSATKPVAITQSIGDIKLIADAAELQTAVLNQAEGQSWIIKNGTYNIQRFDSIKVGGQTGWYFPITASGINITGESKSGVILTSDAKSPNGNWSSQDHISVWGDNVAIENLTIKPKITTNKTVEVMGKNFAIRNVDFVQREDATYQFAGSLFFNPQNGGKDIGTAVVENVLINDAWISCSPLYVSAGALTLKNTTIDFRGAAYANYDYGVISKNDAIIRVAVGSNFRVLVDNAPNLQSQILDKVPAGTTVVLAAGTYYMTAAPIIPSGVTLDTATNNAIIEIMDGNTVKVKNASEFKTALNGTVATIRMAPGTYEFDSQLRITRAVTIIGSGDSTIITKGDTAWTNTTGSKGLAPLITIHSGNNPVKLMDMKVTGAKNVPMTGKTDYGSGINVVSSSNVILQNVTTAANEAAGLIINSSSVSAINLNTRDNGWYGVNVDKADSGDANFTLTGNGVIAEPIQIISDKTVGAFVTAEGYATYTMQGTTKTRWHKGEIKNVASITSGITTNYYETIQAAITAATSGSSIVVLAKGTYNITGTNPLLINKNITVAGIDMEETILKGGSGMSATVSLSNGATLRNLTVTRDNSGSWSGNLNGSLVSFDQNLSADTTLENCIITQGRNGVYLNNTYANGYNAIIRNNKIYDNRTGINLTNNCSYAVITGNEINNNWTVGIVYYNNNTGTALDTINLKNNQIKGNWYGQILLKTPGVTDAPSNLTTGLLDIAANDFGGTSAGTVTIATAYSPSHAEPGYDAQKPAHITEGTPEGTATAPITWSENPWTPPAVRIYKQPLAGVTGAGIVLASYTDGDEGTVNVSTEAQLKSALADTSFTNINLTADISITAMLKVTHAVTIDGKGHVLTVTNDLGDDNESKHALDIFADNVTIKNLTIDSNSKAYGVQAYKANNVKLNNVTIRNSKGAGFTVNGSSVAAVNLNTSGNVWGGINVDPGDGVSEDSSFTITGSGTQAEAVQIWSDGKHVTTEATVTVVAEGYTRNDIGGTTISIWTKPEYQAVTGISGVPTSGTAGTEVDLMTAIVVPANATNKTIEWTVKDAGGTGVATADLSDGKFTPATAGTLVLTATIANGATASTAYTQDLAITIAESDSFGFFKMEDSSSTEGAIDLKSAVETADITVVDITGFVTPLTDAAQQAIETLSAGSTTFTVTRLTWSPADAAYASNTAYSAIIELTSSEGYKFPADGFVPTVDAGTVDADSVGVSGGDVSGNILTFTVIFSATAGTETESDTSESTDE